MPRPKHVEIALVDDRIATEAFSQHDPYPSWGPSWASEPIDATTATPEQIGELVMRTLEHSNNEPWRAPDGWHDDGEHTPMAVALGMRDMGAVRGAGARFVFVFVRDGRFKLNPTINEGRRGGLTGKRPHIKLPADSSAADLGQAVLDGLETSE